MSISMSLEYLLLYLPLLVAVSFVMGATRHEKPALILQQTQRTAVWITSFMLIIYACCSCLVACLVAFWS